MPPGQGASLASRVQRGLQSFYALDDLPPVDHFARTTAGDEREEVLLREVDDAVEIAVVLPPEGLRPPEGSLSLDTLCQVVEGVSHFLYLAERIRTEVPTTQLELELQAEVDKFVVLGFEALARRDHARERAIHARLYDRVSFLHPHGSEERERYRIANTLAARFCARLGGRDPEPTREGRARSSLRAFYRSGQADKIRLAQAA